MGRKETIEALADDGDMKITLSHLCDLGDKAYMNSIVKTSSFLTPAESEKAKRLCGAGELVSCMLYGGYPSAERVCAVFLPDYFSPDDIKREPELAGISVLRLMYDTEFAKSKLTHRDFLGALIGLGIKRESLGDIIVSNGTAYVICLSSVAKFVAENLTSVGRSAVKCRIASASEIKSYEPEYENLCESVSSMRLDAVCAALFNLSRSDARDAVESGRVFVDSAEVRSPDYVAKPGCKISLRGKGKIMLDGSVGVSKKGKIRITAKKFR